MAAADVSRRVFLNRSGAALGGAWLALHLPAVLAIAAEARAAHRRRDDFEVLSPEEARVLEAIAAQIVPSDRTPGAREAGAIYFIDRSLGTFMAGSLTFLRDGLAAFEDAVRTQFPEAASFAELGDADQIRALAAAEETPFFGLVRFLTVAGMFAHPDHGGNRDKLGWQLLGFEDRHAWQPPFGFYDAQPIATEDR